MNNIRASLSHKIQSAGRLQEITLKFSRLESDELRVLTVLRIMELFDTIPPSTCKTKDTKDSIDLRNKANKLFVCNSEPIKTWELYSKSIATALNDSQELSLAYANRSAVLIKLLKYDECLQDIERALRLDYPDRLRGKLLCRKIECLKMSNKTDLLSDTLDALENWLERTSLSSNDKQTFERKLKDWNNEKSTERRLARAEDVPLTIIPNEQIPCASEALKVRCNDEFGRHVVATRDIEPGEILIVEKPYSKILSLNEAYTHCSNCLQVHWAMIPCEFCIYAMYCSEDCKREAWSRHHDIECPVTGYLVDLGSGERELFSMRLTIAAWRDAGCVDNLRESLKAKSNFSVGTLYLSDSYANIYNLVTCVEKRNVADLFDRSLMAAFILYYLCTLTDLFGKKLNADIKDIYMNDGATFIGGLILRHMQIIPCNIHSAIRGRASH
ncbi:SET and MYND domain-containing protein 4-like [Phymastichus coffea]|uniref:SET and MYND domain-containing protein 4-like n=1 Tax=Phymastichus coffea TaxID=108790 RepID=UPI00273BA88C|nr:SET and MYND domain-containing protein 4-like [Phymastichus coffea]